MGLDERTREDLKQWAQKGKLYLWTFAAGGIFTLACTYFPLHSTKDRTIHQLENELREERTRFTEFEEETRAVAARLESQPDPGAFTELQNELAAAADGQSEFEEKLGRADRKLRDMQKSRDDWKAKYAKLENSRDDLADALVGAKASLKAERALAMQRNRIFDTSPSPARSSAADPHAQSAAATDANDAEPGDGEFWQTRSDSGSGPAKLAPGETRATAE
jgi:septal ring factor EnvC (AmiA/AmiB activator)